jgi:hypothetical protein
MPPKELVKKIERRYQPPKDNKQHSGCPRSFRMCSGAAAKTLNKSLCFFGSFNFSGNQKK